MPDYIKWIRSHVGHEKLLLVSVCACIVNDKGELLWQLRGDTNTWSLPGGMIELNENLATAVVREALEETGLQVEPVRVVGVYSSPEFEVCYPNGDVAQPVAVCFECRITGGALAIDGHETKALAWHAPDSWPSPQSPKWCKAIIADFMAGRSEASFQQGSPGKRSSGMSFFKQIRQYIGQARFIMPGAAAFIQNEAGQVLLQRRGDTGGWGTLGGGMELGERIDDTVINEVYEECGLRVEPVRLIGIYSGPEFNVTYPHGDQLKVVIFFFECRITGGTLQADGQESLEVRFFDPTDLPPLEHRHAIRIEDGLAKLPHTIFR